MTDCKNAQWKPEITFAYSLQELESENTDDISGVIIKRSRNIFIPLLKYISNLALYKKLLPFFGS